MNYTNKRQTNVFLRVYSIYCRSLVPSYFVKRSLSEILWSKENFERENVCWYPSAYPKPRRAVTQCDRIRNINNVHERKKISGLIG